MAREYFERKKKIIQDFEKKFNEIREQFKKEDDDIEAQKKEMESVMMNLRFEITDVNDSKSELLE